ncbi:tRNA 2-thiouridine(34) synthase MnmA, partial [Buchnera aphidicola (Hormaphis cornu)]
DHYCSAAQDLHDAEQVCQEIGIPLHKINFSIEYWNKVFKHFLSELKKGRTPNPDILCNTEIKFKEFLNYSINELQADFIATGHYVRTRNSQGNIRLLRGLDVTKDQSYFLHALSPFQIRRSIFPIGNYKKLKVRSIAKQIKLSIANKKDSTGICFIGNKNFKKFLSRYIPENKGDIITTSGEIVGEHIGLTYYTLGQRKGLNIGGIKEKINMPWYVVDKNLTNNALVVAQGKNNFYLMSQGLIANNIKWMSKDIKKDSLNCSVKTRYRQVDVPCYLTFIEDDLVKVIFKFPISSVTPGQYAVFYLSEFCIGGGVILNRIPLYKSSLHYSDKNEY